MVIPVGRGIPAVIQLVEIFALLLQKGKLIRLDVMQSLDDGTVVCPYSIKDSEPHSHTDVSAERQCTLP